MNIITLILSDRGNKLEIMTMMHPSYRVAKGELGILAFFLNAGTDPHLQYWVALMSFVQIYRVIVYTLTLRVVLHLRMRRCEDSVCVFINHDLGESMRIQSQRLSTRVSVEPYTKVTGVEPCTEVTGRKTPELTKPHSNCCHEPPDLNRQVPWPHIR